MGFDFEVIIKHPGVAILALGAFLLAVNEFIASAGSTYYSSSVNEAGWFLIIIGFVVIFFQLILSRSL
jgi:hypothetical protein